MGKILAIFIFISILLIPGHVSAQQGEEYFEAKIIRIDESVILEGLEGSYKGESIEAFVDVETIGQGRQVYNVGDKVVVLSIPHTDGTRFAIVDFVRRDALALLFFVFAVFAVLVGRRWGLASLAGLAYSFFIIFVFILPRIMAGGDPVFTAVVGSALIVPATFYMSHGIKQKTHIAIISTILTLVITGLLAALFIGLAKLTGFAQEEALFLQNTESLNMRGILLAGIIIGVLGVLDDITISQASIVAELREASPKIKAKELYARAMNVGRDHIASLINTLVLVYTGASLPLLLLFTESGRSFAEVVNIEMVADEITRTLVGSIGLILAVPLTTFIASFMVKPKE